MERRNNALPIPVPKNGMGFFNFEEGLDHHIREGFVLAGTGVPGSFFANNFVRDYVRGLEPRHRPAGRMKLTRIIRCIADVTQSEVRLWSLLFILI